MTTLHSPVATGPPWISYSCCWGSRQRSAFLRCAWETWHPRGTCLHQLCSQNLGIQIVASRHVSQTQGACRFCQAAEIGGIWRTLGEWQRVRESRETAYQFALGWDEIGEQEGGWEGGSLPPSVFLHCHQIYNRSCWSISSLLSLPSPQRTFLLAKESTIIPKAILLIVSIMM